MVGILAGVNVAAGSNDTTNTSDKRERSKRSLPFFIPNPAGEKVNAVFRIKEPRMVKKRYCQLKAILADCLPRPRNLYAEQSMSNEFVYGLIVGRIHLT